MKVVNRNEVVETAQVIQNSEFNEVLEPVTHKSYHEMADLPVVERDVLEQLHANLAIIEGLQGRFSFLMKEVRYLIKV